MKLFLVNLIKPINHFKIMVDLNIGTLLPILLFLVKDSNLLLYIIPLILLSQLLFPKIKPYISNIFNRKVNYINFYEYQILSKNRKMANIVFTALNKYIIQEFQKNNYLKLYNKSDYSRKPIYNLISLNQKMALQFNLNNNLYEFKIEYYAESKDNGDINILRIYAKNIQDIYILQKYTMDLYLSNRYKPGIIKRIRYSEYYSNWLETEINIFKSRQTIFLPQNIISDLYSDINKFLNSENNYKTKLQIPYKRGYIFDGLPGAGKTSLVYALSNDFKLLIYKLVIKISKFDQIENLISEIPKRSILLIDDADISLQELKRDNLDSKISEGESKKKIDKHEYFNKFLDILDGYLYLNGVIIILTTNFMDKIDKALIRPGRIDKIYNFTYCEPEIITDIINYYAEDPNPIIQNIKDIKKIQISSSELINTIILPNLDKQDNIISLLANYIKN